MRGGDLPSPGLMTEPPPPPPANLGGDGPHEWGPYGELMPIEPGRGRRPARRGAAPYVELHAHSAFSFLDGASTPLELAVAAAELGYPAVALTDHDGIWGSLEFAHACRGLGLRAITGAEVTVVPWEAPGSPDVARGDRRRLPQPLPAADRGPLAHPRQHGPQRRSAVGEPGAGRGAGRGAGLPLRLRARGGGCRRPRARRGGGGRAAPARGLRPRAPAGRAAAPLLAPRPGPQPPPGRARQAARGALRRDRQRPRPPPLARPPPGCAGRGQPLLHARGLRAAAPRQRQLGDGPAGGDGGPLRRAPRGGRGDAAPRRAAQLRPDQRARLPLSGLRGRGGGRPPGGALRGAARRPLRGLFQPRRGGAAVDRGAAR